MLGFPFALILQVIKLHLLDLALVLRKLLKMDYSTSPSVNLRRLESKLGGNIIVRSEEEATGGAAKRIFRNCGLSASVNFVLLLIILLNGMLSVTLISFTAVSQEQLREFMKAINVKLDRQSGESENLKPISGSPEISGELQALLEKPGKFYPDMQKLTSMKDLKAEDCQCPTCAPMVEIPLNKDPVSYINVFYALKAKYTCATVCENPPIHTSTLEIEGEDGKWTGRASTKQAAKHDAAYDALMMLHPELKDEIEFVDFDYNPRCKDYAFVHLRDEEIERKKC